MSSLSLQQRKPVVEKMRRDHINSSIEELKALLGPQVLNQQPDSKLEMTVCLLRWQLQPQTLPSPDAVHQGFTMNPPRGASALSWWCVDKDTVPWNSAEPFQDLKAILWWGHARFSPASAEQWEESSQERPLEALVDPCRSRPSKSKLSDHIGWWWILKDFSIQACKWQWYHFIKKLLSRKSRFACYWKVNVFREDFLKTVKFANLLVSTLWNVHNCVVIIIVVHENILYFSQNMYFNHNNAVLDF